MFNRDFNSNFQLKLIVFYLINVLQIVQCLYEDQIGAFDWRQHYVGKVKHGFFDPTSVDRIIVATESNVLAAISAKSGEILWRQVLENSPRGDIKLVYFPNSGSSVTTSSSRNRAYDILTVTGNSPALIRGWNANTGSLEWEWSLLPISPEKTENALWFVDDTLLYHVLPVWGSHLEVTEYYAITGQATRSSTSKIQATWIKEANCILVAPYFSCAIKDQVISIDLTSDNGDISTKALDIESDKPPKIVNGAEPALLHGNTIYQLNSEQKIVVNSNDAIYIQDKISDEKIVVLGSVNSNIHKLQISGVILKNGDAFNDMNSMVDYPQTFGAPEILAVRCKMSNKNQLGCRLLLATTDGALVLVQQGKIKWTREESLADITSVDFLELTLSDDEGALEEELKNKDEENSDIEWDIYGAFVRRISSQISHVKNIVLHVLGLGLPPSKAQKAGLVRDSFGLHRMIVIVTNTGKIFGIDNVTGKQHWIKYIPELVGFSNSQKVKLLVQRTSKFYPLTAQCVIVGRHKNTGNGLLYQFNPMTGQSTNGGVVHLDYKIQQMTLLHEVGADFIRGLLILDDNNNIHVLPKSTEKYANNFYLYTADKETAILKGLFIEFVNQQLKATQIWNLNLSGASKTQKIELIESKNPIEHVHSQGRVMADRSVLYKYINPNLIAVATQGPDNIHKFVLNVYLIDVVSGSVVFSMTHKRIKGPLHMVHSENWLVYSYYNEKVRRTEITSVELYEGKTQANSTVWSSLDAPPLPMVERQSYILPVSVAAMKETITEKGITNKHILIGLTTGNVVEMAWAFLDPRRPVTSPEKAREEGIIPYMPELPVHHETMFNYNQTISNLKAIITSPSGLESTCLVLAHGLDIFVTRVAPSKTFDLLKEDFDYFLITVVLTILTTGSYFVKHLASRKAVKQAWK